MKPQAPRTFADSIRRTIEKAIAREQAKQAAAMGKTKTERNTKWTKNESPT